MSRSLAHYQQLSHRPLLSRTTRVPTPANTSGTYLELPPGNIIPLSRGTGAGPPTGQPVVHRQTLAGDQKPAIRANSAARPHTRSCIFSGVLAGSPLGPQLGAGISVGSVLGPVRFARRKVDPRTDRPQRYRARLYRPIVGEIRRARVTVR